MIFGGVSNLLNVYMKEEKRKRGSAIFMSVIAGIVVVSALAVGLTKFMHITFSSTDSASATMQAQQYVRSEAELLHLVDYDDLKAVSKETIKNSDFKKEIKLSSESNYSNRIKMRDVTVNVYKDSELLPRATTTFSRYSASEGGNVSSKVFSIGQNDSVTYTLPGDVKHLSVFVLTNFATHSSGKQTNTLSISGVGEIAMEDYSFATGGKGLGWHFNTSKAGCGDYAVDLQKGTALTLSTTASSGANIEHTLVLLVMS